MKPAPVAFLKEAFYSGLPHGRWCAASFARLTVLHRNVECGVGLNAAGRRRCCRGHVAVDGWVEGNIKGAEGEFSRSQAYLRF